MAKADLTAQRLREVLNYDPLTGVFTWLVQLRHDRPPGALAGTVRGPYLQIGIDQARFYAHRLAWLYMTGEWPRKQIDHKNRDGMNNAWANLRDVSASANCRNTVRGNLHGQGVSKNKGHTWHSKIDIGGSYCFLGNFLSPESAEKAFLMCRALHSQGEAAMREFAVKSRADAAKQVAATKLKIVVNGALLSVPLAAKQMGIPERTAYYRFHKGVYSDLQTPST